MPTTDTIFCVAYSARWMAQSLSNAGIPSRCVDWFADADASPRAEAIRLASWPELLVHVERCQPRGLILGGGFESMLPLAEPLGQLGQRVPLANTPVAAARRVTDPFDLARAADTQGIRFPTTRPGPYQNASQEWLCKQLRRGGGHHVRRCRGEERQDDDRYVQLFIAGEPYSASFLGRPGRAVFLGACRQILGREDWGARGEFQFCGAVGPIALASPLETELQRIGDFLVAEYRLQGLFGFDFVIDLAGQVWLIEVNPRPTSSMECLERAGGGSLLAAHLAEFIPELVARPTAFANGQQPRCAIVAKGIVYQPRRHAIKIDGDLFSWLQHRQQRGLLADIPRLGSTVSAGSPFVTCFASGVEETRVMAKLEQRLREVIARLAAEGSGVDRAP